ncbi:MAG: BRO family protein [Methylorubrum rhodinum]|uniref:BRO-N domain-containing protein n=1 Tax=Methylorubrum rhodinum TaxID=29428 RepID=UPI003BB1AE8B
MDTLNTAFNFTAADADGVVLGEHVIRVVMLDGAPWFVAVDVCRVLGITAPSYAYQRLPTDALRKVDRTTLGLTQGAPMVVISESGLYALVMRSDKPAAGPFQEWVTREVLPAIRRTGGYRLAGVAPEAVKEDTVDAIPDVGSVMRQLVANNTQATELIISNIPSKGIVPLEELIFI